MWTNLLTYHVHQLRNANSDQWRNGGTEADALVSQCGRKELWGVLVDDHVHAGDAKLADHRADGEHRFAVPIGRKGGRYEGEAAQRQAENVRPATAEASVQQVPEENEGGNVHHGEDEEVVQLRSGLQVDGVVGDAAVADQTGDEDKGDDHRFAAEALQEKELCEVVLVVAVAFFVFAVHAILDAFVLQWLNVAHQRGRHWAAVYLGDALQFFVRLGVASFGDEPEGRLGQPSKRRKTILYSKLFLHFLTLTCMINSKVQSERTALV